MKETFKWLAGAGAALLVALGQSLVQFLEQMVPAAAQGSVEWFLQAGLIAVAVRAAGWLVSKLGDAL